MVHILGSMPSPCSLSIANCSLSVLLILAINPLGAINLILLAKGESSIVFPICHSPVVQNKNCFAL